MVSFNPELFQNVQHKAKLFNWVTMIQDISAKLKRLIVCICNTRTYTSMHTALVPILFLTFTSLSDHLFLPLLCHFYFINLYLFFFFSLCFSLFFVSSLHVSLQVDDVTSQSKPSAPLSGNFLSIPGSAHGKSFLHFS